ncbi:MAG: HAD family hydrolase [Desulfobacteraceae bacterium]|nr:MAG: HAD family hydrolase [Desulfobacteraceae bacterium]
MIQAVVFDFGQTLVDSSDGFRVAEKKLQHRIFSDLGLESWEDFLSAYRRIRKVFHEKSDFSRKDLAAAVYGRYGRPPEGGRLESWETEYWEELTASTREFPEARRVLRSLSGTHRLALITNTQGQKVSGGHRILQFPELMRFFEIVIVAGEAGIPEKPDPAPFRLCLERLGIPAPDVVYVGDDWRIDVCGARGAGMHPVWLQHRSVKRHWPRPDGIEIPVAVIETLDALLDIGSLVS